MAINELNAETKVSMRTRVISAIIMGLVALPSILLGGWVFFIFSLFVTGVVAFEILYAPHNEKRYNPFIWIFVYIMLYSIAFWVVFKDNLMNMFKVIGEEESLEGVAWWSFEHAFVDYRTGGGGIASISVSTIAIAVLLFVLFFFQILHEKFSVADVTYLFTMVIFVGIGIQAMLFLRYLPKGIFDALNETADSTYNYNFISTSTLFFYVILVTIMTDTGAYFIGVLFGKHKMNERISPKKTWEGFAGGIAFGTIFGILFLFILSICGYPVLPVFDLSNPINWLNVIGISLVLPFTATLGDFIFSAIKRHYGIKDFSNIIKGHGGFLDRLDSIITASIIAAIIIIFMTNNWSFLA